MTSDLETLKARLIELDSTIHRLEETLEQRREERVGILQAIDRAIDATTTALVPEPPIHRLPTEILMKILQDTSTEQRRRNITLMRVCSRWLNIVSNMAFFWSDIVLEVGRPAHARALISYAKTCLARSKSTELSIALRMERYKVQEDIYLTMLDDIYPHIPNAMVELETVVGNYHYLIMTSADQDSSFTRVLFIALLLVLRGHDDSFTSRWACLELDFGDVRWDVYGIKFVWEMLPPATPNLKHIHISGKDVWGKDCVVPPNFGHVQNLQFIGKNSPPPSFYTVLRHLQQLSLHLECMFSFTALMKGLASAPFLALGYLGIEGTNYQWPTSPTFHLIRLPSLVSLSIKGNLYDHILPYIDAPLLECLEIFYKHSKEVIPAIPTFPSVSRLRWYAYTSEKSSLDSRLIELIPKLPQLQQVYSLYDCKYAKIEDTVAHLVREGQTNAVFVNKEQEYVNNFQMPLFWDEPTEPRFS